MEMNALERDYNEVESGSWVKDIPGAGDLELKVRGLSAEEVISYRASRERAVPRKDRNPDGSLKMNAGYQVLCDTLVEKVLLDWKNLTEDGKQVKYSKEVAKKLMANKRFRPFHDAVVYAASVVDQGQDAEREEAAGNS